MILEVQSPTTDHHTHWSCFAIALLALVLLTSCNTPAPSGSGVRATEGVSGVTRLPATKPPAPATLTNSLHPTPIPKSMPTESVSSPEIATRRPTALATPTAASALAPVLPGTLVTQTVHLDLYRVEGGLLITTVLELAPAFEEAVALVGLRMGAQLHGRVAIGFEAPQTGACALRGLTRSHERTIQLYYGPESSRQIVLPIVAHELAHEFQHDYYGWDAHQRSDTILLEGQATWASADYSRGANGRPTWASAAEQALAQNQLLPLATNLERDCRRTTRNAAYTGWASFVDYLITTYGRERFDLLYRSGHGRDPGSADYTAVYGRSLDDLDQEWRAWLTARPRK